MRLLALDTDTNATKQRFLSINEREILTTFRHGFFFFLSIIFQIILTIGIIVTGVAINIWNILPWSLSPWWIVGILTLLWFFFALPQILRAFLDWKFDCIFVTTDKVVLMNQSSLFHRRITPMHLENVASVTAASQFCNIFAFGSLHFQLKEGMGKDITMKYIPNADEVAAKISDTVTQYQRRFMERPLSPAPHEKTNEAGVVPL